ncbi:MAG: thermonuclease family protein [Actinomycetes bacterium]
MRRAAVLMAGVLLLAGCALPEAPPVRPAPVDLSEPLPVPHGAQGAVVVSVTDGDTVRLRGRGVGPVPGEPTRVRLLLVDTPEVADGGECFGGQAADRTEQLLPRGAEVRVEADRDLEDRFGRLLLHVWTDDGVNVGETLVAEGYATVLQLDPNRRYLERFEAREQQARDARRGLWSAC